VEFDELESVETAVSFEPEMKKWKRWKWWRGRRLTTRCDVSRRTSCSMIAALLSPLRGWATTVTRRNTRRRRRRRKEENYSPQQIKI